jgi:hypothetical protein
VVEYDRSAANVMMGLLDSLGLDPTEWKSLLVFFLDISHFGKS